MHNKLYESGAFKVAPALDTVALEKIFQHKVLGMLLRKDKITEEIAKLILSWRHSGFHVHCGPRIQPGDDEAMENLARYVVRASYSQERMTCISEDPRSSSDQKMGETRKPLTRWSGWRPCVSMFRTRGSRWSVTMASSVTSLGEDGRSRARMDWCLVSCNQRNHPGGSARTGRGLSRKSAR